MRNGWAILVGVSVWATMGARDSLGASAEVPRSRLEKHVYRNAQGTALPYRLLVPRNYDPAKRYPLVVFLHGAGERGVDNEAQLIHAQPLRLVDDDVAARHPAFFLAPQCPPDARWVEVDWDRKTPHVTPAKPSRPMQLLLELLDELERRYAIDPARRYATGISMGGFGTLDLCVRRPKAFAAAVPICGGGDVARAADLSGIAFWIFHGGADSVVVPELSRQMAQALRKAGAAVRYTEYPGVDHFSWGRAYGEADLPDWLFGRRRGSP
jgi:predicted peptidase